MTETGDVIGSYSVLMPDGMIYTITYNVIDNQGFNATLQISEPSIVKSNTLLEAEDEGSSTLEVEDEESSTPPELEDEGSITPLEVEDEGDLL